MIIFHLLGHFMAGTGGGSIVHVIQGTLGWLKEKDAQKLAEDIAADKVKSASYKIRYAHVGHLLITLSLLLAFLFGRQYLHLDLEANQHLALWTGWAIAWWFGVTIKK